MDRKLQDQQELERLIRLSENARACLGAEVVSLKHRLDVPNRLRSSLKSHPTGWLFGSAASGLAASLLFRRKPARPQKKPRGLPFTLLGLVLTVLRPMAKVWLTGQVRNYLTGQAQHPALNRRVVESSHTPTPF